MVHCLSGLGGQDTARALGGHANTVYTNLLAFHRNGLASVRLSRSSGVPAGVDAKTVASICRIAVLPYFLRGQLMRLLVANIKWPPETFLWRLMEGLVERGVELTVASDTRPVHAWRARPRQKWLPSPSWTGSLARRTARLAPLVVRAAASHPDDLLRSLQSLVRNRRRRGVEAFYRTAALRGTWDVVYFPWAMIPSGMIEHFAGRAPIVTSCRGRQVNVRPYCPDGENSRAGLREVFNAAAAVHCVSDDIRREAVVHGLDPAKARVIRPAVDPSFFTPGEAPESEHGFRIVTTGSLIWRKGFEYQLSAVRWLVNRGEHVSMDIIGEGPERQRVSYTIHDLRIQDSVAVRGKLPPEAVRDCLQQADVFVLSSLSEGISNAVLEAMSCGVPVVTTDCGGMREAVTDGVEGFVVPVRDPESMAAALGRLVSDPELRRRMGEAGRQRILREFTLERQIDQWMGLFESVLAEKAVRAAEASA